MTNEREQATFGGGCFWCLEAVYEQATGVEHVESGYAGGHVQNPTYQEVCSGRSGHAEVVQVTFDPTIITYRELVEIFFTIHDPTTRDRQGADVGPQYRSVIYFHTPDQQQVALQVIDELQRNGVFDAPIVTEIEPLDIFYPAEPEHREYYRRNPSQGYCRVVIAPKVAAFRNRHAHLLRSES
jgi:peptide-methionine (S)-S-oxide reductase